jgi:7-cyano-7-deazaguanine synthase in queuosine biosynthesis
VILYSGGLDSVIMDHYAREKHPDASITKVYFDLGHEYNWKEKMSLPEDVIVHNMTWFQARGHDKDGINSGSIFIPGRNLLFAVTAACKYLPDEIWLGSLQGEIHDHATDKNYKFRDETSDLLSYVLSPFLDNVKIRFPLAEAGFGKLEATRWALQHGLSHLVIKSSSCMDPVYHACGKCVVCARRWGIFKRLQNEGYTIPMDAFAFDPVWAEENRKMFCEMLSAELGMVESHYDQYRRAEIVPALKLYFQTEDLRKIKEALACGSIQ